MKNLHKLQPCFREWHRFSGYFFKILPQPKKIYTSANRGAYNLPDKDTRNCPEKAVKISHFNPNKSAPSIYIMIELCYFSLDQWEIRIHLLWGKSFNIPLHCDPHLNQTKWLIFNDLLPLTIPGVLGTAVLPKPKPNANLSLATGQSMKILKICLRSVRGQDKIFVPVKKWALVDSEAAPLIPVAAALNKK